MIFKHLWIQFLITHAHRIKLLSIATLYCVGFICLICFTRLSYAIDCDNVNERLGMTKLFIDKSILLQEQQDRIIDVYLNFLDPLKVYFYKDDYQYIQSEFGFTKIEGGTMTVDCALIDMIGDLFIERLHSARDFVQTLSYEDIKPDTDRTFEFYYDPGDFAQGPEEAGERLLARARLETLIIHLSASKINDSKLLKIIRKTFSSLIDFYDAHSSRGKEHLYNSFIQAVYMAIDRDIGYLSDEIMKSIKQQNNLKNLTNTHNSTLDERISHREQHRSSLLGSLMNMTRDWAEPFWRVSSVHDNHNQVVLSDDLIHPGDMVLAMSSGSSRSLHDLGYSNSLTDLHSRTLFTALSDSKKITTLLVMRKSQDDAKLRLVTITQKGTGLPLEFGILPMNAHHHSFDAPIDISYVKIVTFPDHNNPHTLKLFGGIQKVIQELAEHSPDVILLDLRFHNPHDNGHKSWDAVQEFMSVFLPPGVSCGYVRQRFLDKEEEAYLLHTEKPDTLSDEQYEKFLNTPLVVLTSYQSREYHEWMAHIFKHYRRALIVGDAFTATKDTVNSSEFLSKTDFISTLPSIRLYTPTGENFSKNPLLADVVIPSFMPSETTLDIRYPENSYDDSLSEFEATPHGDDEVDWVTDQIIDTLTTRSLQRTKYDTHMKRYIQLEQSVSRSKVMRHRPRRITLDLNTVEHIHNVTATPSPPDRDLSAKGIYLWGQSILDHDHTVVEAMKLSADYFISLTDTSLPDTNLWSLSPDPKLLPAESQTDSRRQKSSKKSKKKTGGFGF